ncbi:MBL fold metallo-hydrolase [Glutamicibacter sp.]|uniref:MBL fold metallo-hydrolase n=1 Tax=Glutamicibacter sp. TaxID=1931995 RepID=UPI0028BEE5DC|nr:MBL fold metallo-hydrolase [Glutamicibacter sp.]
MDHLPSPTVLASGISVLRAENPSEMTLDGTNSYLLFDQGLDAPSAGSAVIVVDPGPQLEEHMAALAAFDVRLILSTHRHPDHTAAVARLHELTGAPARARLEQFCHGAPVLEDGEVIVAAGTSVQVVLTPGHTSDSLCLVQLGAHPQLLTGDTVLGRGTTILEHPDGTLADYLDSLAKLAALPDMPLRPGHGEQHAGSHRLLAAYIKHREERLEQVRAALAKLGKAGADAQPAELLEFVYPDLDPRLVGAASHSIQAQLHYLATKS